MTVLGCTDDRTGIFSKFFLPDEQKSEIADRDVDVDDVAVAEGVIVGNAVARDVVDGRADGLGKAAVAERRRVGVQPHAAVMRDGVDPIGGHA